MTTNDPDRCTEILPDGTIYTFSINRSNDLAHELLEQLYALEGQELDFDFTAAVFSLFVESIHILTDSGWSIEELLNEVVTHGQPGGVDDFQE